MYYMIFFETKYQSFLPFEDFMNKRIDRFLFFHPLDRVLRATSMQEC